MRIVIFTISIMAVIGSDHRHIVLLCKPEQSIINDFLLFYTVPLQFDKIVFTKKVQPPFEFLLCFFFSFIKNGLRYICANTTGCCDQSLMIFLNKFLIDTGILAIHPLDIPK